MALSRRIAVRGHVKGPLGAALGAEREPAVAPDETLAVRLRGLLRRLRSTARRGAAAETVLRALSGAHAGDSVAGRLVDLAFDWLGGHGWAVLAVDEGHGLSWLCDRGVAGARRTAVTALANHVVDAGTARWSADASGLAPSLIRRPFSALALPLRSGGQVVGVLAGIDAAVPEDDDSAIPDEDLGALWLLLDPIASALDAGLRLARAEKLSSIDDLTGLYNSRFLAGAMQREAKRALRTRRPLSILFVDLDGFKGINDRWGHLCGSRALVEAAARIAAGARETDIVARYGGDEFAVVLPETPHEGAMIVAQRVRERIASHAFLEDEGICYRLTASVGAATLPACARSAEELIAAADAAMYRVKARGKDGIEMAARNKAAEGTL